MDAQLLNRVMTLAEKTGDRVIVVNPQTGKAFALLPFEAYEALTGMQGTEPEAVPAIVGSMSREALVDKINQDIASWNNAKQSQKEIDDVVPMDVLDEEAHEEQYYLEPIE